MLIPNLNEILEEFAKTVEETTFEPLMIVNERELHESICETKIEVEEGREKRKEKNNRAAKKKLKIS